jgi:hypothetical protein
MSTPISPNVPGAGPRAEPEAPKSDETPQGAASQGATPPSAPARGRLPPLSEAALRFYDDFLSYNFIGALLVSACFLFVLFYRYKPGAEPSIFLIATFAGSLGAFVSSLTRMYNFADLPAAFAMEKTSFRRRTMLIYSFVPAVIGTIAAAILYLVFASQIVTGALFPSFACLPGKECTTIGSLIDDFGPDKAHDYAKMIFWGFAAGFSERLVPDLVTRLARSGSFAPADGATSAG